jgi:hypothetical protein
MMSIISDRRMTHRYRYWPIRIIRHRYRGRPFGWHGWSQPTSGGFGWILHLWYFGIKFGRDR